MKKIFLFLILFNTTLLYSQYNILTNFFNYIPFADKIAYPVNHGSMNGYYDANPFQNPIEVEGRRHLGADINGIIDGNSDEGDTIYSIGNGIVTLIRITKYEDGYISSLISILHCTKKGWIVSQYRHCQRPLVFLYEKVYYLQPISTFGNEDGGYTAHLHFEIRTDISKGIENGYGDPTGYVDPIKFIKDYNK